MRYLPVSIDTRNKKILIVGGGRVAYRKVKTLLDTEFTIDLVSMDFIDDFKTLENNPRLSFTLKEVDDNFSFGAYSYILIATSNRTVNKILEDKAKAAGIPFLNASDAERSDFIMHKLVTKNELTVSLSTGGKNPALLHLLSEQIELLLENIDREKTVELHKIRQNLKAKGVKDIGKRIQDLYKKPLEEIKMYGAKQCE